MKILGVDPGLTRCGLGIIDSSGARQVSFVDVSVARTRSDTDLARRLSTIGEAVEARLDEYRPAVVAMERVFAQQNLHTVMGVAQVTGVVMFLCAKRNIPVHLHTPSEVKAAVSGYGSADKKQVQHMVAKILRLDAPPQPADAADALAIAICHAWRGSGQRTSSGTITAAQQKWLDAERQQRK